MLLHRSVRNMTSIPTHWSMKEVTSSSSLWMLSASCLQRIDTTLIESALVALSSGDPERKLAGNRSLRSSLCAPNALRGFHPLTAVLTLSIPIATEVVVLLSAGEDATT